MSVDDHSAKDSIVLGADLVEALGFEPVTVESDIDRPAVPSNGTGDRRDNGFSESVGRSSGVAVDTEIDVPEIDVSRESVGEPIAEAGIDDDQLVEAQPGDESSGLAARFGVRGLFSRQQESPTTDHTESVVGDGMSTRELFAAEAQPEATLGADADVEEHQAEAFGAGDSVDIIALGDDSADDLLDPIGPPFGDEPHDHEIEDPGVQQMTVTDSEAPTSSSLNAEIDLDEPTEVDLRFDSEVESTLNPLRSGETRQPPAPARTITAATGIMASKKQTKLRARKSRRVIRHIDPWSVLTFSILFHLAFFAALLLAGVLVWNAAIAAGTIENIENFIRELADYETFEINSDQVFRASVVIAGMLTLASSVLVVLLTVVFNLISDLIGGIRVTVIEEETVRVPAPRK